jgi:WhiB family transcriptional regulator, redox-sensing transcriptional regulator
LRPPGKPGGLSVFRARLSLPSKGNTVFAYEQVQKVWWDEALCNDGTGALLDLFFSEQLDDIAVAKAFCQPCPVREACLAGALARREPWGVWGGELLANGKVLAQKRKRGRPPKTRPETEVPAATAVPLSA